MNFEITLSDETPHIIECAFKEMWTWHDCREATQVIMYHQDAANRRVSIVYDFTQSRLSARKTGTNLKKLLSLKMYPPPELIVLVEKPLRLPTMRVVVSGISGGIIPEHIVLVESMKEARQLLEQESSFR